MKLSSILVQALAGIPSTLAAPVPSTEDSNAANQGSSLFARQLIDEICGGQCMYSLQPEFLLLMTYLSSYIHRYTAKSSQNERRPAHRGRQPSVGF